MSKNKYKYSEIFTSIQGEGEFTGRPTVWLRWFLCNLQCSGFGQDVPEDTSTHILPYKDFDISKIKRIQDLPVIQVTVGLRSIRICALRIVPRKLQIS
jgi:organic radical activating enzyme